MKKLLFVTLVVILVAGLILGGCAKPAPTPTKVLKIGASLTMTQTMGVQAKKWLDLFAKLYNDAGGWEIGGEKYKVEVIVYDNQNDQVKAKSDVERLVLQDGVKFILGGSASAAVDAIVTEPNKVLLCEQDMTGEGVKPNLQYWFGTCDTTWGRGTNYSIYTDFMSRGCKTIVDIKSDDMMGHYVDMLCTSAAKAVGLTVLPSVFYDPSTSDFGPIATKVKSLNPDCVSVMYAAEIQIIPALRDAGYKGPIELSMPVEDDLPQMITKVGKEYLEGAEGVIQDPRGYQKDPRMLSLLDAYVKEYGKLDLNGIFFGADNWLVVEDAINATQSVDTDVLKKYLDNSPAPARTLVGWTTMLARPDVGNFRTIDGCFSHGVGIVRDGNWEVFKTVPCKDMYLCSIKVRNMLDVYKKYWEEYGYPKFPDEEKGTGIMKYSDFGITGQD
jgi:ABC-type branched-subunit amino acid transport system substrate-binding protein